MDPRLQRLEKFLKKNQKLNKQLNSTIKELRKKIEIKEIMTLPKRSTLDFNEYSYKLRRDFLEKNMDKLMEIYNSLISTLSLRSTYLILEDLDPIYILDYKEKIINLLKNMDNTLNEIHAITDLGPGFFKYKKDQEYIKSIINVLTKFESRFNEIQKRINYLNQI